MSAGETLKALYASLGAGDMPAAMALMDENVEWVESAGFLYAGTYRGPQSVVGEVFARLGGEWDGFRADPDYLVADGDRAIAVGTYSGTYRATGRSFTARFAHSVLVRDGRIVHFEQVVDSAQVNLALAA